MRLSDKMKNFSSSIFIDLVHKKAEVAAKGIDTIDLSVGTPDLPPPPHVTAALAQACQNPENMKYALVDLPGLIDAVRGWYSERYGAALEPDEICSLSGSQDGLAHLPLCLLDPGDTAFVPDPGYPIFIGGPLVASAKLYPLALREESGFLPDLGAIPASVAHDARMMIFSYPMNPLCRMAPPEFFERVIRFAQKYDIVLVHDNAYSELTYDGRTCGSFLSFAGAKDVGVEFNSLSKSYNMTGMRISFALGNRHIIGALRKFKSNIDYGVFLPVQHAAVAALQGPYSFVENLRKTYQLRRDTLVSSFSGALWPITPPDATMFAWARIPGGFSSSMDFTMRLADETGIIVTPGSAFGRLGEGYVRIALVQNERRLSEASVRVARFLGKRA